MTTLQSKTPMHRDVLTYGLILTATVAFAGFSLSARRLHDYGMQFLGESESAAWLVPTAFDLPPLALSLVVYAARKNGRRALVWRGGILGFAAISAAINYFDAQDTDRFTQFVTVALPLSAVIALEGIMSEIERPARADKVFARIPLTAWALTPRRAFAAYKTRTLIPLRQLEIQLAEDEVKEETPQVNPRDTVPPPQSRIILPSQETVRRVNETASRETPRPKPSTAPRGMTAEVETQIRELLTNQPDITVRAAAEILKMAPATAGRHLKAFKDKIK